MKSTVKTLSFALSLCVSLSALAACNTSGTPMSSTNPQQSGAQSGLSIEAQAALASYHDADASFSDTSRVASSGQFKTKQLLGGGDSNGSGSGSISIGVGASGSGSTSGGTSNGSTSGSGSTSVGVDANANASGSGSSGSSDGSSSGSGSVGVGANAGASGSGSSSSGSSNGSSSASGNLGVGVDANASGSGSGSGSGSTGSGSTSGSGNLGVGVDANASGSGSTTGSNGSSSGSGNLGVGTNVNATGSSSGSSNGSSSGSSSGSLNLGTSLNANAMLDSFNRFSSIDQNRTRFASDTGVSFDSQGNSTIDESRLATNISSRLSANTDLQSMRNSSASQANSTAGAQISADSLLRLRNRNFQATGMDGGSRTNADGSVTSTFMTQFVGNGTDRRISYASQQKGNVRVGAEAVLTETGTGFTRSGSRQTDFQADGSAQVTTSVMTTLSNGDRLEVLEDRFTNAQGEGSGFGSFRLTRNDGSSSSGDLRTMVTADGSLTTFFDSDNNNQDFALRSDANGALSLVGRGSNGSFGDNWSMLDFSTVLNSAIQASASRSGNRSASSANAAANTATAVNGSSSSN